MILAVCKNIQLLQRLEIFNIIIKYGRIIIPVLLIVLGIMNFVKTRKNSDERIVKAGRGKAIKKVIFAILFFFLPSIVYYINGLIYPDQESFLLCLENAYEENILKVRKEVQEENIKNFEDSFAKLKETFSKEDYDNTLNYLEKLPNSQDRASYKEELDSIETYVNIEIEIEELKEKFNKSKYRKIFEKVSELDDEVAKEILLEHLSKLDTGTPLEISTGLSTKAYGNMTYYEIVPNYPTTNMPLIIYLHGDGGFSSDNYVNNFILKGYGYNKDDFIYIAPHPNSYDNGKKWDNSDVRSSLKSLIDHVVSEYQIDQKRIIIIGYANGATGTWDMVSAYPDFFSAAVPVSGVASIFNANSFKNTAVWSFAGDSGNEINIANTIKGYVSSIKGIGGKATFAEQKGRDTSKMANTLGSAEIINWTLNQKLP